MTFAAVYTILYLYIYNYSFTEQNSLGFAIFRALTILLNNFMAKTKNTFEQDLFKAADKLRKNIDAAEYKHVVLGLIFLKYISESFNELYQKLEADEWSDRKIGMSILP